MKDIAGMWFLKPRTVQTAFRWEISEVIKLGCDWANLKEAQTPGDLKVIAGGI